VEERRGMERTGKGGRGEKRGEGKERSKGTRARVGKRREGAGVRSLHFCS